MKLAMALQLSGFIVYGLLAGEANSYRIEHERAFTATVLIHASMKTLGEIPINEIKI